MKLMGGGALVLALGGAVMLTAGCASVPMARFETATRIDLLANPGFSEYSPEFQAEYDRIRQMRGAVCRDPAVITSIYRTLSQYRHGWANYWAIPPESPPIVLIFHSDTQWLGTLDLYEGAMGHVHNLIHRIPSREALDIVRRVRSCAEASENTAHRAAYR